MKRINNKQKTTLIYRFKKAKQHGFLTRDFCNHMARRLNVKIAFVFPIYLQILHDYRLGS